MTTSATAAAKANYITQDGWYGFDLDGTLAKHEPSRTAANNFDPTMIGEPIPRMIAKAKKHMADGYEVRIVTARVGYHPDEDAQQHDAVLGAIEDWAEEHLGERVTVTNEKDYEMLRLYDDRCTQVIPNTGITMIELVAMLRRGLEQADGGDISFGADVEDYLEDADA